MEGMQKRRERQRQRQRQRQRHTKVAISLVDCKQLLDGVASSRSMVREHEHEHYKGRTQDLGWKGS